MKTFSQQKRKWKVKDVDTQEVRDKNRNEKQFEITAINDGKTLNETEISMLH